MPNGLASMLRMLASPFGKRLFAGRESQQKAARIL